MFYIENESKSLAQHEEFEIQNYLDMGINNPEMNDFLSTKNLERFLSDVKESEHLNLNLMEGLKANTLPDWMRPRFLKLKTKIKKILCDLIRKIGDLTTEDIIKAVLVTLIPAFGA